MIAFLRGRVAGKAIDHCLIEVGGVGYRLAMTTSSLAGLPAEGDEVLVHTYLHVREDELSLFGFESIAEKNAFELLITVSGVGPKVALATLSSLAPDTLAMAVETEDHTLISSVPGIGKKTAQRIVLDLKGKFVGVTAPVGTGAIGASPSAARSEATGALLSMGFSAMEAAAALKDAPSGDAQALLRHALRMLGGGA